MTSPTPDALFVVTLDDDGTCSFMPPAQEVLRGGDVTLVAVGARSIPLVALLSSTGQPYTPFGGDSNQYEATAEGTRYQLEIGEVSTGFLKVPGDIVTTYPTGRIVPVAPMWLSPGAFTPRVITATMGGKVLLTWTGGGPEVQITTMLGDRVYPLFGGSGTYEVPAKGQVFTVDSFTPEGPYSVVFDRLEGDAGAPVRGTINVIMKK